MKIRKAFYFMKEGFHNIESRFKEAKNYEEEFKYYIELIRKNPKILSEATYRGSEAREMLKRIDIVARMYEFANDQQEIAYRMTHVFFISVYENHIRQLLKTVLNHDHSLLVSRNYTFADISSKSADEIKELIKSRLDNLVNVHNLEKFFDDKLGIKISIIFSGWDSFVENYYRRHIIVHHHGIFSQRYIDRTNGPASLLGTEIVSTFDYIKEMAKNTCTLMGLLTGHILSKFGWSITGKPLDPDEILAKIKRNP